MARKPTSAAGKAPVAKTKTMPTDASAIVTPARNSAVPPKSAAAPVIAPKPVTKLPPSYDAIATRAYYIWQSSGGSEFDNWLRAERELSI